MKINFFKFKRSVAIEDSMSAYNYPKIEVVKIKERIVEKLTDEQFKELIKPYQDNLKLKQ